MAELSQEFLWGSMIRNQAGKFMVSMFIGRSLKKWIIGNY